MDIYQTLKEEAEDTALICRTPEGSVVVVDADCVETVEALPSGGTRLWMKSGVAHTVCESALFILGLEASP